VKIALAACTEDMPRMVRRATVRGRGVDMEKADMRFG